MSLEKCSSPISIVPLKFDSNRNCLTVESERNVQNGSFHDSEFSPTLNSPCAHKLILEIPSEDIPNWAPNESQEKQIDCLAVPPNVRSHSSCSSTYSALSDCILNSTHIGHPLLGSPSTCGFWSPLPREISPTPTLESVKTQPPSPVCSTSLKVNSSCKLVQDLIAVGERLDALTFETKKMRHDTHEFARSFKRLVTRVDKLLREATDLRRDLADVAYLEQIVHLLNGDFSRVNLRNWPFRVFMPLTIEKCDLVI